MKDPEEYSLKIQRYIQFEKGVKRISRGEFVFATFLTVIFFTILWLALTPSGQEFFTTIRVLWPGGFIFYHAVALTKTG